MRKRHAFLLLGMVMMAVLATGVAGCHKPEPEPPFEPIENPDTTGISFLLVLPELQQEPKELAKTTYDGRELAWAAGDEIYINGSDRTHRGSVVCRDGAWQATMPSALEADGGSYYACYPGGGAATNAVYYSEGSFTVSLPSTYTATRGSLGAPMVGVADSSRTIRFRNICAIVKLNYTYAAPDTVVIADSGILAGAFTASFDGDSLWTVAPAGSGSSAVTVVNPSFQSTIYIPVPEGDHKLTVGNRGMVSSVYMKAGYVYTLNMGVAGRLAGEFGVAAGRTVHFSQGNLRYQASGGRWRFASRQSDVVGSGNANLGSTYGGWIDLFGWGTSGWNSGATYYRPYDNNTNVEGYNPGGRADSDLGGDYANADWGVYNAIENGGNAAGLWRTLTHDEWVYLLTARPASTVGGVADARYAKASVDGVFGLLLLPDVYSHPSGVAPLQNINEATASFSDNSYSGTQWAEMEAEGAVFLPVAGRRRNREYESPLEGRYWSATHHESAFAYATLFFSGNVNPNLTQQRSFGFSVRLVCE
ncbi:MAG: hypothetical protein IJU81_05810 [Bacteroidales bacterium]|nr:hypothetical protein [Bacteroidales bacterium]